MFRLRYAWWIALVIALLTPALLPSTASASGYPQPSQYAGGEWQTAAQEHHLRLQTMQEMRNMMQTMHDTMQKMQNMMQTMRDTMQVMQTMQTMMQKCQAMMQTMQTMMQNMPNTQTMQTMMQKCQAMMQTMQTTMQRMCPHWPSKPHQHRA